MRIVAGKNRGATIFVPDIDETRPTMDRTRQAVFNILRSASWALRDDGTPILHDALVLDVFAGSGAMGFEALSQGAANAVFFEQHPKAIEAIEKNKIKLRYGDARVIKGDVTKPPVNTGQPAQMAFFDPPYQQDLLGPALQMLHYKGWLDTNTLLVLEMHKGEVLQYDITHFDARIYGTSKIVFGKLK